MLPGARGGSSPFLHIPALLRGWETGKNNPGMFSPPAAAASRSQHGSEIPADVPRGSLGFIPLNSAFGKEFCALSCFSGSF